MINNKLRIGNFTSSEIVALTVVGNRDMTKEELSNRPKKGVGSSAKKIEDLTILGTKAKTYISEKNMERRLGRSLTTETSARPLSWGKMLEAFVIPELGKEYLPCSKSTMKHPKIDFWSGSPDAEKFVEKEKVSVDIKCPITLKSFCTLVDSYHNGGSKAVKKAKNVLKITDKEALDKVYKFAGITKIREDHKDGEKYYWQIVSNAILMGATKGEILVYCPYTDELDAIRDLADNYDGLHAHQYFWITVASDDELPNIKRGGHYQNINKLTFDIPQEDIDFLTSRVKVAGKSLIKRK